MEKTVRAIVLRRTDSGESDRRVTLFSREQGKIDAVAKGARKNGSRLAGSSDPLCESILTFAAGRKQRFITQSQPQNSFRGIRSDYDRLRYGLALAELAAAILPFEQPDEELYDHLLASFKQIAEHAKPLVALLWAEVRIVGLAGFTPEFSVCVVTGDEIVATEPFVSPQAGGAVSDIAALRFGDRFRTSREVLIALSRLADEEVPPPNVRQIERCLTTWVPFVRGVSETALLAHDSIVSDANSPKIVESRVN